MPEPSKEIIRLEDIHNVLELGVGKVNRLCDALDNQLNILIGISSAIFIYAASSYASSDRLVFLVLAAFTAVSAGVAFVAVHPFKFLRKRKKGMKESIFYNRRIAKYDSVDEYRADIAAIVADREKIIDQYSLEIYNLSKYYYRPKRKLYAYSRNILVLGIAFSLLVFICLYVLSRLGFS